MTADAKIPNLTPALEDYLETIYRLVGQHGFARVRDIANARHVNPASVSPALRRLDDLDLVQYERREYIGLTKDGEVAARRIYSRHQVLRRFFRDLLGLPSEVAEEDACAAEHSLSAQAADMLVRLFEFIEVCPEADDWMKRFRNCALVQPDKETCEHHCPALLELTNLQPSCTIADLQSGQRARIYQIEAQGELRQRLVDMGLLPGSQLELIRKQEDTGAVRVAMQGYEIELQQSEAGVVLVEKQ